MYPYWQSGSTIHSGPHPVIVSGLGIRPVRHLQIGCPFLFGEQVVPGPQGDGLHGSGFSTHFWLAQTNPYLQSGSTVHSGPHPVIVSGLGISPAKHLQIGFPSALGVHVVPGPQGEGLQGSLTLQRISGVGSGTRPSGHLQVGFPSLGIHIEPSPQGLGSQGFLGGSYLGCGGGGGGGGVLSKQVLAHPSKQQSPQLGQSISATPTDQQVLCAP